MSFGFSVGDVFVCSKVAYSAYSALKNAPEEFAELSLEVLSLTQTLRALAEEASSESSIILLASPQRQESLRVLLENCKKGLTQLELLVVKSKSLGANEKTRFLEHVRFAARGKQGPRDKLAIHTASINIFLTSLTHSSLGRLELLIKNALQGTSSSGIGTSTGQSNPWTSIVHELSLEGFQAKDVEHFRHEIMAYTRHLICGGEPYWKKTPRPVDGPHPPPAYSRPENAYPRPDSHPEKQRPNPNPPAEFSRRRKSREKAEAGNPYQPEQRPLRPIIPSGNVAQQPQAAPGGVEVGFEWSRPPKESRPPNETSGTTNLGSPGQMTGPHNSQTVEEFDTIGDGVARMSDRFDEDRFGYIEHEDDSKEEPALTAPSNRPGVSPGANVSPERPQKPAFLFNGSESSSKINPEQQHTGNSGFGQQPSKPAFGGFGQSTGTSFGQPSGTTTPAPSTNSSNPFGNPTTSTPTAGGLFGSKPASSDGFSSTSGLFGKSQNNAPASGGLFGSNRPQSLFGAPQNNTPTTGSIFESEPPSEGAVQTGSGSLFGGFPTSQQQQPTDKLFGTPPKQNETENTNLFGSAQRPQYQRPDPSGLYGSHNPSAPAPTNPFGLNKPNSFGNPPEETTHVDELKNLFDHIFDLDDSIPEIVDVSARVVQPNESAREVPLQPIVALPLHTVPPPAFVPSENRGFSFTPQTVNRAPTYPPAPSPRPPPIHHSSLPEPVHPSHPPSIRATLLNTVRTQLENAIAQLRNAQRSQDTFTVANIFANTINERVRYLRAAGCIVVQCDLCIAPVIDMHWTCDTCNSGDWDACVQCVESERGCPGGHGLRERSAKEWARREWNGQPYWTEV